MSNDSLSRGTLSRRIRWMVPVKAILMIAVAYVIFAAIQLYVLVNTEQQLVLQRERQEIKIIKDLLENTLINIARSTQDISTNNAVVQLVALNLEKLDPDLKAQIIAQATASIQKVLANFTEITGISVVSINDCYTFKQYQDKISNQPLWSFEDWDSLANLKPTEVILQANPSVASRGMLGIKMIAALQTTTGQNIGALLIAIEIPITRLMRTKGFTDYLLATSEGEIIGATGNYQQETSIASIFGKLAVPAFNSQTTDFFIRSNQIIVLGHPSFGKDLKLLLISVETKNYYQRFAMPVILGMFLSMLFTFLVYLIMNYSLRQRVSPRVVAKLYREQSELKSVLQYTNAQLGDPREIAKLLVPDPNYVASLTKKYNIELNYLSKPAGFIGGDLWGVVESPNQQLCVYLIDVCGHGVQAGLETLSLRAIFEDSIIHGISVDEAIHRLNRAVEHLFLPGRFITMMVIKIDKPQDMCELYCMGANYIFIQNLVRQEARQPSDQGSMLGIFDQLNVGKCSITWLTGTRLVLFSDGLSEVRDRQGKVLGTEKIKNIVTKYYANTQTELLTALEAAWAQHKGIYSQEDDLSIIVVNAL